MHGRPLRMEFGYFGVHRASSAISVLGPDFASRASKHSRAPVKHPDSICSPLDDVPKPVSREQLSSFAIHSAELLIRRRMKDITWVRYSSKVYTNSMFFCIRHTVLEALV